MSVPFFGDAATPDDTDALDLKSACGKVEEQTKRAVCRFQIRSYRTEVDRFETTHRLEFNDNFTVNKQIKAVLSDHSIPIVDRNWQLPYRHVIENI